MPSNLHSLEGSQRSGVRKDSEHVTSVTVDAVLKKVASDTRTGELGGRVIFRRRFACSHKERTSSGTAAGLSRWKRGFVQIMGLVR